MALELNNLQPTVGKVLGKVYQDAGSTGNFLPFQIGHPADLIAQSLRALRSFDFAHGLEILKMVGMIATIVFGSLFVWVLLKMNRYFKERMTKLKLEIRPPAGGQGPLEARWQEVKRHLDSIKEAEWKFALIEADKIVDDILRQAGFSGETLGERLKGILPGQLVSLQALWSAHKLRNAMAHDVNFNARYAEIKEAIGNYEKALQELGALN